MTRPGPTAIRATTMAVLTLTLAVSVSACGKKASPAPIGPPDQVTYPKSYPTQ